MNEDADLWKEHKEQSKAKKAHNRDASIEYLMNMNIPVKLLSDIAGHYRVVDINFWPATGKFHDQKEGVTGRGVKNLIKYLYKKYPLQRYE